MALNPRMLRERRLDAARGYLMLDMPDQALQELAAIEQPEKCAGEFHLLRGEALRNKKDYHAALAAYNRALAERPRNVTILMGMAWCHKRTGQLPRAIAAMEEAYRISPQEPIVLYNLACYYALDRNKAQALSWLGRAIRMQSSLRDLIPQETDFDPLRQDPDFQLIAGTREDAPQA